MLLISRRLCMSMAKKAPKILWACWVWRPLLFFSFSFFLITPFGSSSQFIWEPQNENDKWRSHCPINVKLMMFDSSKFYLWKELQNILFRGASDHRYDISLGVIRACKTPWISKQSEGRNQRNPCTSCGEGWRRNNHLGPRFYGVSSCFNEGLFCFLLGLWKKPLAVFTYLFEGNSAISPHSWCCSATS